MPVLSRQHAHRMCMLNPQDLQDLLVHHPIPQHEHIQHLVGCKVMCGDLWQHFAMIDAVRVTKSNT